MARGMWIPNRIEDDGLGSEDDGGDQNYRHPEL